MCCKFVNLLVNFQKHGEGLFLFLERINAFILPNFAIFFGRNHYKSTSSQFKKEAYIESNIRSKRKRKTEEVTEGGQKEYRECRYN